MKIYLAASTCALILVAGGAVAQTTSSETTSSASTTASVVAAPAPGTLSATDTRSSNNGNCNTVASKKTTCGNAYESGSAKKSITAAGSNGIVVAHTPTFSLNTPVDVIAADQGGKAVLDRDVPGLMASRSYILFDDMSLSQIATVSRGQLTKTKLDLIQADLSQLSDPAP